MKKLLTLALVGAMLTATGITAFAAPVTQDNADPKQGTTTVNYSYNPINYYTVVIPETVNLSDTSDTTETISIYGQSTNYNVSIPNGKKVNVALTESLNNFTVINDKNEALAYKVNGKNDTAELTSVASCTNGNQAEQQITFSQIENNNGYTGDFSDTLTFTVSLENAAAAPSVDQDVQILDAWSDIVAACNDGSYKTKYEIGNWKELDLGTEGIVKMKIVAMDADELADGSGNKAPITWISEQLLNTPHIMNPPREFGKEGTGTIGGWEKSEMRAYLNETILPLITDNESALSPASNGIKVVKKYTIIVNTSEEVENNKVTTDSVWIPSAWEMFGSGSEFETMGANYSEVFTDDASRVKKMSGGNAAWWWLRSANDNSYFNRVGKDGSSYIGIANSTGGVALGFCT